MSDWKKAICQSVGTERLGNISGYISSVNKSQTSAVDEFYKETKLIMAISPPDVLNTSDWLGALLALAIVSCTENYFRNIFCSILKICSDSQKLAAKNDINFGSVIWHPNEVIERGAFENISLAGADSIIKTTRKYTGIEIKPNNNVYAILEEFDKVCELRHGIIHSQKVLAGKNAIILKVPSSTLITKINIRFAQLQEISSICTTLIVAFNQLLFEQMCKRWATSWRTSPFWNQQNEYQYFKEIWNSFHSVIDEGNGTIPEPMTAIKCRNLVKKEFNL
jgi:hypothetical protein